MTHEPSTMPEHEQRLKDAYQRRRTLPHSRYSLLNPAYLFMQQSRQRAMTAIFSELSINDFSKLKILDVGCGNGGLLSDLLQYGAISQNLYGIDLLSERVARTKNILPFSDIRLGNATALPWPDTSFDIAVQFTVFTSILEPKIKQQTAAEILRVLKPGGFLLWYDFHMDNPSNPDVKGVGRHEISTLFPGCKSHFKRITLAPPLSRMIAPYSIVCCQLLEKICLLNTHYIGYIRKS